MRTEPRTSTGTFISDGFSSETARPLGLSAFGERYFDEAYGYVILYTVTRIGFGFGGAYGKGLVIERDELVGTTKYYQFTSGIQAGGKVFSMIVFFKDKETMDKLKQLQFVGQTSFAVANYGAGKDPAYDKGVAIFSRTKGGLMGEATVSGAKLTFKPLVEPGGTTDAQPAAANLAPIPRSAVTE